MPELRPKIVARNPDKYERWLRNGSGVLTYLSVHHTACDQLCVVYLRIFMMQCAVVQDRVPDAVGVLNPGIQPQTDDGAAVGNGQAG